MSVLDWVVLIGTITFIVGYGSWKTLRQKNIYGYLLGDRSMGWFTIGLSIMATQASAITFLSTPGQAYNDGMRFIQFYFGLPIAIVIISTVVVPIYHKLRVYTAYEFLESRFDVNVRVFTASLFLIQRSLAAGFTIFAPSLALSVVLGWDIYWTNIIIGTLVISYTVLGGTRAVNITQKQQMFVIILGMGFAGYMILHLLPAGISFADALKVAGSTGKLNAIDLEFDFQNKYNIWTGLIGGTFLALSYFGTDQSQVQRYLGGSSITQSRLGLIFNGILKIPMQFLVLLVGAMLFVFYIFHERPLFFNSSIESQVVGQQYQAEFKELKSNYRDLDKTRKQKAYDLLDAYKQQDPAHIQSARASLQTADKRSKELKERASSLVEASNPDADTNDLNYIFLNFIVLMLPAGLVGLLIAVILSAGMSSTASELNALASTTVVDIYKRVFYPNGSESHYLNASRLITLMWGIFAILFANVCNRFGTLIEAVNILGSLFYGTVLGVFVVAFFIKQIRSRITLISAILAELLVITLFLSTNIPYLWFNVIGCLALIVLAGVLHLTLQNRETT